jgi:hypothetical protein
MKIVRHLVTYAVSRVRSRGGWIIVTLQDGSVDNLEPNVVGVVTETVNMAGKYAVSSASYGRRSTTIRTRRRRPRLDIGIVGADLRQRPFACGYLIFRAAVRSPRLGLGINPAHSTGLVQIQLIEDAVYCAVQRKTSERIIAC